MPAGWKTPFRPWRSSTRRAKAIASAAACPCRQNQVHRKPAFAIRRRRRRPPSVRTRKSSSDEAPALLCSRVAKGELSLIELFQPEAQLVFVFAGQIALDQLAMEAGGPFLHGIGRFGAGE